MYERTVRIIVDRHGEPIVPTSKYLMEFWSTCVSNRLGVVGHLKKSSL